MLINNRKAITLIKKKVAYLKGKLSLKHVCKKIVSTRHCPGTENSIQEPFLPLLPTSEKKVILLV